jgi:hypothetical protein
LRADRAAHPQRSLARRARCRREACVDESTFIPKRFVAERFVENPPFSFRYLITVDTAMIGGHLVNVGAYGHFEVHRGLIYNYAL